MKVTVEFIDSQSLTVEEITASAKSMFGDFSTVKIEPESGMAYDHIYFGLQQLLTHRQLQCLHDKLTPYNISVKELRSEVLGKITEILDQVIVDNEDKVT